MATVEKTYLTEAEYLARERAAEFKSEFFRGEILAMAGATYPHNRIKDNCIGELAPQLKGGPCFTLSSDQRVKILSTGLYVYPDITIICGEPKFEDGVFDTLLNPRVIFEVLSESTEAYDRGTKFGHYRQLPDLQEYVLVATERPIVERYLRQPNGDWLLTEFAGLDAIVALQSAEARLAMADIYAGIEFQTRGPFSRPVMP